MGRAHTFRVVNRRSFLLKSAFALTAGSWMRGRRPEAGLVLPARPRPSPSQLAWQRDELALFLHFGVNTFTDREWGDGKESPSIFAPTNLDARQWARTARLAGARAMILTAKHHDGFCLWPTRTTTHSVASSPFRNGQGDVVREFVDACRVSGLRAGLYLSPWDRNSPAYGDSPRYNDVYAAQLTELLTNYGPIAEVWFDGANGEGPNGKRQVYDWPRVWALVRRLQPDAVMFSDAGPDVRWCGNEKGLAGDPNWSTVNPSVVTYPGQDAPGITEALQHGDPNGTVWRPAEVDVSIRPGWFYHPAEDDRVRSTGNLLELYFTSVGRNGKLLLNVPPTREGLLHPTDIIRLSDAHGKRKALFEEDLAAQARHEWRLTSERGGELLVTVPRQRAITFARLEEDISRGQVVSRYTIYGASKGGPWRELGSGTTIGYTRLHALTARDVEQVRLVVEGVDALVAPVMKLY